jgi:outer membrane receptor protein involved in Fe transport
MRFKPLLLLVLAVALVQARALAAQTIGGSLQGVVTDPSGASVPGARVVITSVDTGAARELTTDDGGRYHVPLLPPGEYEIRVTARGFRPLVQRGAQLAVGQTLVVDLAVQVGTVETAVTVTADSPRINLANGSVSGLVDDHQIRDLPLNGRSFQQLALLQPGVTSALAAGNDVVGGRTPKISINGARPEQNSFLLDGTDINNVYNKTPGSVAGVLLGVDAVLEFQVLTNAYSAEFGKAAGGVINAVTRSGTNQFHGSAFAFRRDSALDAKNYFDPKDKPIPPFTRNQFGATVGGPLRTDRTFFFGAYEGLVERLGVTGLTAVPDDNARRGVLPTGSVPLHAAIPRYLEVLFPHANGRSLGGGVSELQFTLTQPTEEHFGQARLDHRFASGDSVFGRYTISNGSVDRQPTVKPPIAFTRESSRNQYATIDYRHLFSPNLLGTFKGGFNRSVSLADNVRTIDIPPDMSWIPGEPFGYLTVQGMVTEMAGDYRLPRNDHLNNFQWDQTLFWTKGRNDIKIGVQGQYLQFDQDTTSQRGGIVTFTSLSNFLQGIAQGVDFAVAGKIDPIRNYRQQFWGFFAQDDLRWRPSLTLNLGVRYEFVTTPTEANGKISNLRSITDTALTIGAPWHSNPSLANVAPRLGVAWDPFRNGRTAVRGGFGLFYDEILPKYYFFTGSLNPPFTTRTSIANPPFPNVVANFDPDAPIRAQLQTVNYDLQTPFITQYNASVQQALPGNWDVTVGYVGSRGRNLLRVGDANLAPDTTVNGVKTYLPALGRRNPNFVGVWQRVTDGESFYNALQVAANRRSANGLRAQISYTLARSVDDSSGINSQDFDNNVQYVLDWYDREYDRGRSAFNVTHNLTFNWTWDIGRGWQINNVTALMSGTPFTVRLGFNRSGNLNTTNFSMNERPDLKPGCDPILGGPDRYWDVSCFALPAANTRGNLQRNSLTGPGLVNADVALVKSFAFGSARLVQLRAEAFNVFNHPNFAVPSGRVAFTGVDAQGNPVVAPTWGRITSTVTTARQIQLGVKFGF